MDSDNVSWFADQDGDLSSIEDMDIFQDVMKQMSESELVSHYDQMSEMIDEGMFDGGTEGAKSFADELNNIAGALLIWNLISIPFFSFYNNVEEP